MTSAEIRLRIFEALATVCDSEHNILQRGEHAFKWIMTGTIEGAKEAQDEPDGHTMD